MIHFLIYRKKSQEKMLYEIGDNLVWTFDFQLGW